MEGEIRLTLFAVENGAVFTVSVAVSRGRRGQLCVLSSWRVAGLAVIQVKVSREIIRQNEVRGR